MYERFQTRQITEAQAGLMETTRRMGIALAEHFVQATPAGPEREQAITWLQAAVLLVNQAISRHEPWSPKKTST